ncbi:MAG: transposase [Proteobacteria bacterium]|nr:transposase [Pseudomonadota bacterium]MCG2738997.1 transposase [Syntrophaceae bacterium]
MPRVSRAIAVGYPHHITQRGNYRQTVFAEESDYTRYLEFLAGFAPKYGLDIWAYCLMPNHIHIVGVPGSQESLARTFNTVHMLYAQYFNRKRNATGHLWQGRFFSCVLDERHLYAAVRYVEMNPVRSGIASAPQDYPWCSAKTHVTGAHDPILSGRCFLTETVKDWAKYLGEDQDREATDSVIKATKIGRPCGKEDFVRQMEGLLNRRLTASPRGRPWKKEEDREN